MEQKDIKTVCSTKLFRGCDENEVLELLYLFSAHEESFRKGSFILHTGDKTNQLGILLSGHALIIQEDWWGNRNILHDVTEGDVFAEAFACVDNAALTVSVNVDMDSRVIFLNVDSILQSTGHKAQSKVLGNFIADLAFKNLRFSEKLRHLGGRTTRAKLLSYLSAEAERFHSNSFDIPFSRQALADYLFVERSGLSNELMKMQSEGLLKTERNHFELLK